MQMLGQILFLLGWALQPESHGETLGTVLPQWGSPLIFEATNGLDPCTQLRLCLLGQKKPGGELKQQLVAGKEAQVKDGDDEIMVPWLESGSGSLLGSWMGVKEGGACLAGGQHGATSDARQAWQPPWLEIPLSWSLTWLSPSCGPLRG